MVGMHGSGQTLARDTYPFWSRTADERISRRVRPCGRMCWVGGRCTALERRADSRLVVVISKSE